jgi:hypothetical protein
MLSGEIEATYSLTAGWFCWSRFTDVWMLCCDSTVSSRACPKTVTFYAPAKMTTIENNTMRNSCETCIRERTTSHRSTNFSGELRKPPFAEKSFCPA